MMYCSGNSKLRVLLSLLLWWVCCIHRCCVVSIELDPFCIFTWEPCGFAGGLFGKKVHTTATSTGRCQNKCVIFTFIPIWFDGYSCGGCDNQYNMELQLLVPKEHEFYFDNAATFWENVITDDLPDYTNHVLFGISLIFQPIFRFLPADCRFPLFIDDLYICVFYTEIDGGFKIDEDTGLRLPNILAAAGPFPPSLRRNSGLPTNGLLFFDQDDVEFLIESDRMEEVARHEMAHVLGFGTLWPSQDLIELISDEECYYNGIYAQEEYKVLTGCDTIPMTPSGCDHWREECLNSELLTSSLKNDTLNDIQPISRISIAAFQDLGYSVDYSFAGAYDLDDLNINCTCKDGILTGSFLKNDEVTDNDAAVVVPEIVYQHAEKVLRERLQQKPSTLMTNIVSYPFKLSDIDTISTMVQYGDNMHGVMVHN